MQALDLLLREFGQSIDLPELAFDDEDCCTLTFDDLAVVLSYRREQEKLCLYTDVGLIEHASRETLLGLLEANALHRFVGDGVIGVCPDDEGRAYVVVYSMLLDAESLNLARLDRALRGFLEMAETWRDKVTGHAADAGRDDDDDDSPAADGNVELMRV